MQTGDIVKVKGKTYEVWEEGENNLILRSLCSSHYFITIHKSMIPKHYASTTKDNNARS
jgi:hypothetical protein